MAKADLRIDWATHAAAKYACENWHYSKSVPMPPLVKIGAWEKEKYIGCVLFGRGASPKLGAAYGLKQTECVELVRIALTQHDTPVSRIVRMAMQFLKRKSPELRLVISFADPAAGHHGGVYQAGNWIYCGQSAKKFDYVGPDGKTYLSRQVAESGVVRQFGKATKVYKRSECKAVPVPGKHRYLMPLDAEMKARILLLSKPYPKRAKEQDSGDHPALGGATPTCTLQSKA